MLKAVVTTRLSSAVMKAAIAASVELRERDALKSVGLAASMAQALIDRGVPEATAQLAAEELIEPGMTGEQAHQLAQRVIEEAGHGEHFGHGLGHGIGLQVHEAPRLALKSTSVLKEGQVFSVEPGIYLSGWGGVRIEDLVVLENGRCRVLSRAPKVQIPARGQTTGIPGEQV